MGRARTLPGVLEPPTVTAERRAIPEGPEGARSSETESPLDFLAKGIKQLQELHLRKESQDPGRERGGLLGVGL